MSDRDVLSSSSRRGEERRQRGDGDKDRTGQRDKTRGDREKGRHKDRDHPHPRRNLENEERSHSESSNAQAPVVLLRRPPGQLAASASTSASSKQTEGSSQKKEKQEESSNPSEPNSARGPVILARQNVPAKPQESGKSGKSEASSQPKLKPLQLAKLIMEPTIFEHDHAVPVIDRNMKMMPTDSFKFFPGKGKYTGDYFVVTAVGKIGTGKSAILSYLAEELTNFESKDLEAPIFQNRSRNNQLESQIYITSNNTILIEMAPVFSCAATYDLAAQPGNLETTSLTWNLKVMRWALSVSHVVLILSDNLLDPNICQLMSSAEVVHPMDSALGEGVYPEIIFVYNKVPEEMLTEPIEEQHQSILKTIIGRNPRVYPNLFLIPDIHTLENKDCMSTRLNGLLCAVNRFSKYNRSTLIQGTSEFPKIPQKYSAHDWYCNAVKLWESMDSPAYFAAYVKLFP